MKCLSTLIEIVISCALALIIGAGFTQLVPALNDALLGSAVVWMKR